MVLYNPNGIHFTGPKLNRGCMHIKYNYKQMHNYRNWQL